MDPELPPPPPWWQGPVWFLPRFAAAVVLAYAVVIVVGNALNRAALAAMAREPGAVSSGTDVRNRTLYRAIVWLASLLFYLSLPLVVVVTFGVIAALWAGFVYLHVGPFRYLALLGVGGLFTVFAMLHALFASRDPSLPGVPLVLADHPRFAARLQDVARRLETRGPDEVRLVGGVELAVTETGGRLALLFGRSRRVLLLGVGLLDGLSAASFDALLAHELGHFAHEDTAGGHLALGVRVTIRELVEGLVHSGVATNVNPAWLFLQWYCRTFVRITQGASRLQEVLADRSALHAYGTRAFVDGFRHFLRQKIAFGMALDVVVERALREDEPVPNLYAATRAVTVDPELVEARLGQVLAEETEEFASHPAPKERIAAAEALAIPSVETEQGLAWELLDHRARLETELTEELRQTLLAGGLALPRPTRAAPKRRREG